MCIKSILKVYTRGLVPPPHFSGFIISVILMKDLSVFMTPLYIHVNNCSIKNYSNTDTVCVCSCVYYYRIGLSCIFTVSAIVNIDSDVNML